MQVNPKITPKKEEKESKKKKKQKEKKEKHQNIMKDLPPSAFSCITHPTEYLRILTKQHKNPPNCKSCGFKLSGKFGYYSCVKSSNCFFLCSACKICTQNHILRLVISLKQFKNNPLYSQNKYNCHGCKQEKEVDKRGVWHCGPCTFSICPECMDRTNNLWENLILKSNPDEE